MFNTTKKLTPKAPSQADTQSKVNLNHKIPPPKTTEKTINIKTISKLTNININSNFIKKKKIKKKNTKNRRYNVE